MIPESVRAQHQPARCGGLQGGDGRLATRRVGAEPPRDHVGAAVGLGGRRRHRSRVDLQLGPGVIIGQTSDTVVVNPVRPTVTRPTDCGRGAVPRPRRPQCTTAHHDRPPPSTARRARRRWRPSRAQRRRGSDHRVAGREKLAAKLARLHRQRPEQPPGIRPTTTPRRRRLRIAVAPSVSMNTASWFHRCTSIPTSAHACGATEVDFNVFAFGLAVFGDTARRTSRRRCRRPAPARHRKGSARSSSEVTGSTSGERDWRDRRVPRDRPPWAHGGPATAATARDRRECRDRSTHGREPSSTGWRRSDRVRSGAMSRRVRAPTARQRCSRLSGTCSTIDAALATSASRPVSSSSDSNCSISAILASM